MGSYGIFYKGQLWARKVNRNAAQSLAFLLARSKGWDIQQVIVKDVNRNEVTRVSNANIAQETR